MDGRSWHICAAAARGAPPLARPGFEQGRGLCDRVAVGIFFVACLSPARCAPTVGCDMPPAPALLPKAVSPANLCPSLQHWRLLRCCVFTLHLDRDLYIISNLVQNNSDKGYLGHQLRAGGAGPSLPSRRDVPFAIAPLVFLGVVGVSSRTEPGRGDGATGSGWRWRQKDPVPGALP